MGKGLWLTAKRHASNSPDLERAALKRLEGLESKLGTQTKLVTASTVSLYEAGAGECGVSLRTEVRSVPTADGLNLQGAPECCNSDEGEQTSSRLCLKAADIWSLGCLFSNMLIRSSLGHEGVDRYREAREAANKDTIMGGYAPQCFHDGVDRLRCVDEFHDEALRKYPNDDVLRAVSDTILHYMLRPPERRESDALTIRASWLNRINESNNNVGSPVTAGTSSPASPVAPSSQPALFTPPPPQAPAPPSTKPPLLPASFRQLTLPPLPPAPFRPTLPQPPPIPETATTASIMPSGTKPGITTVRQIADHLRRSQQLWPSFSRSGPDFATIFPGLSSPLSAVGPRNHVCVFVHPTADGRNANLSLTICGSIS